MNQPKRRKSFLESFLNLYGVHEKTKSDWGNAFISKNHKVFRKRKIIKAQYSLPRLHTGTGVVERAIQTVKSSVFAILEDRIILTQSINQALRVMQLTIHTRLKVSPLELHHSRKPRTELTNIVKVNNIYLSDWTTLNVSVPPKQNLTYLTRSEKRELTVHIIMARKRKILCCTSHKSPKRK